MYISMYGTLECNTFKQSKRMSQKEQSAHAYNFLFRITVIRKKNAYNKGVVITRDWNVTICIHIVIYFSYFPFFFFLEFLKFY